MYMYMCVVFVYVSLVSFGCFVCCFAYCVVFALVRCQLRPVVKRVQSGKMGPAPGRFQLSKGMLN